MAKILVVEDDLDQLNVRKQILEHAGYDVETAQNASDALDRLSGCQVLLMDLQLPTPEDGMRLIHAASASARIIVLSGAEPNVSLPVDEFVTKPCSSKKLLEVIARFCVLLFCWCALRAETFNVSAPQREVVAELDLRAPGTDWATEGHEAALATVIVDGNAQQQVMLYAGATRFTYQVFLGMLSAGQHDLKVSGDGIQMMKVRFREDSSDVLVHAPILYARANTVGKYTDVPLLVYCERWLEDGETRLQYTVIFFNEDGGTSTRALMARWGRTTDIEYVYRASLSRGGAVKRATIQTKDHKEVDFQGNRDGKHPLLMPITDNNMVGEADTHIAIRYQIAPILVDLSNHSREEVMDQHPITYKVMAQELKREGKLRPYGTVDGEKIGEPMNYLYLEMKLARSESAVASLIRLQGNPLWFSSNLGRTDYAISTWKRNGAESPSGFVRTTIELPPGTTREQISEIGFQCLVPEKTPDAPCRVEAVTRCFFLDRDYKPGPNIWSLAAAQDIAAGQTWTSALR